MGVWFVRSAQLSNPSSIVMAPNSAVTVQEKKLPSKFSTRELSPEPAGLRPVRRRRGPAGDQRDVDERASGRALELALDSVGNCRDAQPGELVPRLSDRGQPDPGEPGHGDIVEAD